MWGEYTIPLLQIFSHKQQHSYLSTIAIERCIAHTVCIVYIFFLRSENTNKCSASMTTQIFCVGRRCCGWLAVEEEVLHYERNYHWKFSIQKNCNFSSLGLFSYFIFHHNSDSSLFSCSLSCANRTRAHCGIILIWWIPRCNGMWNLMQPERVFVFFCLQLLFAYPH